MEQKIMSTTTKGITISLVLIVISLVTYFANVEVNGPAKWLGFLLFIAGIIWSVSYYGKQINYNSTFGNYFAHGFKTSAVVTVLMIIFTIIFLLLFPELKERAVDEARKQMQAKNNLTQEQMDQAIDITRRFFMTIAIGGALIGYLLFGAIASLIGAAITKKIPNQFANDINQIGS